MSLRDNQTKALRVVADWCRENGKQWRLIHLGMNSQKLGQKDVFDVALDRRVHRVYFENIDSAFDYIMVAFNGKTRLLHLQSMSKIFLEKFQRPATCGICFEETFQSGVCSHCLECLHRDCLVKWWRNSAVQKQGKCPFCSGVVATPKD